MKNQNNIDKSKETQEIIVRYDHDKNYLKSVVFNMLKDEGKVKVSGMGTMINFVVQIIENVKILWLQV